MSRFFKSAAFPILIVVVLAFFAQKLISPGDKTEPPKYSQFLQQVDNGQVKSTTLSTKNNRVDVELKSGTKYQTAYPDNTEQNLINQLRDENVAVDVKPKGGSGWLTALTYILPVRDLPAVLAVHHQPDAGRRLEGHVLREVAREADVGGRSEDHLPRRGGCRRGGRGAPRDQGIPREPQEVPGARSAHPQGCPALRTAGHRQDAAGARRRRRGRGSVLLDLRL